jgi:hypothetical protein
VIERGLPDDPAFDIFQMTSVLPVAQEAATTAGYHEADLGFQPV